MKKILFVGEHPLLYSGNSGMMAGLLERVDDSKYEVICFAQKDRELDPLVLARKMPFTIIPAADYGAGWGEQRLLQVIDRLDINAMVMVGIDIWKYAGIFPQIKEMRGRKGFQWAAIFPYDLQQIRKDWLEWIKDIDYPCVYSEYGYNLLKDHVENIRYFRPPLRLTEFWQPLLEEERLKYRKSMFKDFLKDNTVIFGWVGVNQIRKDPIKLIKAFALVTKERENVVLYSNSDLSNGTYNFAQMMEDYKIEQGYVLMKPPSKFYNVPDMVRVYNCLDCVVNCSMQEGLSWTPLEAMLCGVPVIVSDTTAHPELVAPDCGILVPCETPSLLPVMTHLGNGWVETKSCKEEDVAEAMLKIIDNKELREELSKKGLERARKWIEGVSDINVLLQEMTTEKPKPVKPISRFIDAVLFAQHSAAGDVLMTTRCLKGLKERHPDLYFIYMTSPQYKGIVEGCEYVNEVIDWDERKLKQFRYVYNPHGDRIAPGHWGRNCNSILSDFYWKILMVEPSDFYVGMKEPNELLINTWKKKIAIVHTTGGDKQFRNYKYMEEICVCLEKMGFITVQLGGRGDCDAGAMVDLRGRLLWQETNWVMNQAVLAITIDSYMSHLAGALGVTQICLFGSGNYVVVRPNQMRGELVCMVPDYVKDCKGLGPCSASVRDCPVPCTGKHDPYDIIREIERLEREDKIRKNFEKDEKWVTIFQKERRI